MDLASVSPDSPIEEKVRWATLIHERLGEPLLADQRIFGLLERLKSAIRLSCEARQAAGISVYCQRCEEEQGGSCCGLGIENRYDGVLLLINLLIGTGLPKERTDPKGCFFLGKKGCSLRARHVICVNYLCKDISERIPPGQIRTLQEREGAELGTLFLFHEQLKRVLRQLSREGKGG